MLRHALRVKKWDRACERRNDGGFDLPGLIGEKVTAIRLIGLTEIIFGDAHEFKLQIERDFVVRVPSSATGAKVEFQPYLEGWTPTGMNELVALFGRTVTQACASPDATLRIDLSEGYGITVSPDPRFEGWNLWWPENVLGQPAGGGFV